MPSSSPKVEQIFSASDVKHGLSLFTSEEISAVERLIEDRDGKFYIKCQINDRYKIAKPEEDEEEIPEELEGANRKRKAELKKEIKALQNKINKLTKEISQRTLAGQISLVLNDEKITEAFKKYWP